MPQALSQRYTGGHLVKDHQLIKEDLWVKDGKIVSPQSRVDQTIAMDGKIIAPGYIDLQINGAFGVDFATQWDNLEKIASGLRRQGVLNFLPTLISSPLDHYKQWRAHYSHHPAILGVHLEGPFINREKAGAHSRKMIQSISSEAVLEALEGGKLVTLAPEMPNAIALIRQLSAKGIVVAAGHSLATVEESKLAFEAGLKMVTHLFNAMTPIHHRQPGLAVAALTNPSIYYSIIADGIHLHPEMVKLAWQTKPDKLILVTDAMAAMGLGDGLYRLGEQVIEVKEGHAYVAGTKRLAGSALQMDQAVRNLYAITGCSIPQAIEAATLRPAELLGIAGRKGTLVVGADADLIFLDHDLNVQGWSCTTEE